MNTPERVNTAICDGTPRGILGTDEEEAHGAAEAGAIFPHHAANSARVRSKRWSRAMRGGAMTECGDGGDASPEKASAKCRHVRNRDVAQSTPHHIAEEHAAFASVFFDPVCRG